jgi:hypothetical protein
LIKQQFFFYIHFNPSTQGTHSPPTFLPLCPYNAFFNHCNIMKQDILLHHIFYPLIPLIMSPWAMSLTNPLVTEPDGSILLIQKLTTGYDLDITSPHPITITSLPKTHRQFCFCICLFIFPVATFKEGSPPQFRVYFSFLTLAPGKETDQPHAPDVLPLVTWCPSACSRRLVGPSNWSECFRYWESSHISSVMQPIT